MDGRGSIKELFPTGKQLEPLVAPLADGKVAVGQDDLTVVLNEEGVCTQKCALNWTDIPIAMGKTFLCSVFLRLFTFEVWPWWSYICFYAKKLLHTLSKMLFCPFMTLDVFAKS